MFKSSQHKSRITIIIWKTPCLFLANGRGYQLKDLERARYHKKYLMFKILTILAATDVQLPHKALGLPDISVLVADLTQTTKETMLIYVMTALKSTLIRISKRSKQLMYRVITAITPFWEFFSTLMDIMISEYHLARYFYIIIFHCSNYYQHYNFNFI